MVSSSIFQYIKEDNVSERMLENQVKTLKNCGQILFGSKNIWIFSKHQNDKKTSYSKTTHTQKHSSNSIENNKNSFNCLTKHTIAMMIKLLSVKIKWLLLQWIFDKFSCWSRNYFYKRKIALATCSISQCKYES